MDSSGRRSINSSANSRGNGWSHLAGLNDPCLFPRWQEYSALTVLSVAARVASRDKEVRYARLAESVDRCIRDGAVRKDRWAGRCRWRSASRASPFGASGERDYAPLSDDRARRALSGKSAGPPRSSHGLSDRRGGGLEREAQLPNPGPLH